MMKSKSKSKSKTMMTTSRAMKMDQTLIQPN
jgi:hypothetical protein